MSNEIPKVVGPLEDSSLLAPPSLLAGLLSASVLLSSKTIV